MIKIYIVWQDHLKKETGVYEDEMNFPSCEWSTEFESAVDWWLKGNGDCDCNRALHFQGEEQATCGDSRFDILEIGKVEEDGE